ncbi:hypothetical protein A2917_00075 [Candidatus Nomurabacteria bacterium RIFCSPLOWO2_01_FULL_42_17]|uniref:Uncharacterized protein n=1 Tax=Candidatus Nomurabacteria bacterium RIFCSPLOWO2_01_FULL_42_17 TaxID=1801780 RepID=A0A1F6XNK5_9BACT|nr:MAG: hypothetical protein A2917_00075 [Candidatus Nomurabacteria bacterium RIFCSPLOWO2_01_FULL_42_17]
MSSSIFDRISFVSLFLVIVLLPLFFLPFTNIPVETSKGLLLVLGLAVCVIGWGLARFFDGRIILPRSANLLAGGGIVLAFFLSAIFSKASQVSFFGTMFDIGTFWFVFAGFLLMLMSAIILRDPKKAKIVLFGAILSGAFVMIFQAARFFLPEFLSFGVLVGKTGNALGSWNALGIFAGFSTLMSLVVVEFFSTTKIEKIILQVLTILSMVIVAAVNFPFVWELIGVFALIIFVYKVSLASKGRAEGAEKTPFPVFSFIIILITLLFFISGQLIGGYLPNRLGLTNSEVRPSLSATISVTKSVLKEDPVFGSGPNRFGEAWAMHKPVSVNLTPFWDVSFNSGSGLLPTFAATTGSFGILALLIFFFLFLKSGVKSIFSSIKHGSNWETMAFFVLALYMFVACFFYSGGAVIFLLALSFAGIFIGLSASLHSRGEIAISYLNDHRKSFFSILFIVFLLLVSAALTFKYAERLMSVSYFGRALSAPSIPVAEASISKALALHQNDLYLRTYAQIYLLKLNSLVTKGSSLSEEDKVTLQATLDQAINGAELAIKYNPNNYLNFQTLGSLYQSLASFGVKDAYSKAMEAYKLAVVLNPNNPGLKLALANVSLAEKRTKEAKDYANEALALKANYLDAFIILSQIARSEGDNALALSYGQTALSLDPDNEDLIKYVETLRRAATAVAPTTKKK